MVCLQTKNPNFGKFWILLQWNMLVYFVAIRSIFPPFGICILRPFATFCGRLVYFSHFGTLIREIWQPWGGWPDEFMKKSPKILSNLFFFNLMQNLNRGKKKPKPWTAFVI
jgi:hypothetical protein